MMGYDGLQNLEYFLNSRRLPNSVILDAESSAKRNGALQSLSAQSCFAALDGALHQCLPEADQDADASV